MGIESENLATHVALCHERYKALHRSLERGDRRMARIERILWGVMGVLVVINIPAFKDFLGLIK